MIQDIEPKKLYNHYIKIEPKSDSPVCAFRDGKLLIRTEENESPDRVEFPTLKDFSEPIDTEFLFSIDETDYFLAFGTPACEEAAAGRENQAPGSLGTCPVPEGYGYSAFMQIREKKTEAGASMFAACTAYHLWRWYSVNRFCGCCGHPTVRDDRERALICPECGNHIYPRLNPAVIVGVINGDRILITKYRVGYGHSALVAGFTEIGETFEQTVMREVMEEAGVRVKNIRYYKSQPWGPAEDILAGFYCEVDGDDTVKMDTGELKYAEWVRREDIVLQPAEYSLTNEMMKMFKEGVVTRP